MESQDYTDNDNIVYQDNKSSILLEKNGKASSSKHTKHINIRYFFITGQICNNKVSVVWCPTGDMITDFVTKPLQGADMIMGVVPAQDPGRGKLKTPPMDATSVSRRNKGKKGLVTAQEERHHRSVLGFDY
jgi:hypothetical protein